MSGSVNKVFLLGNLGQDPEIRSTQTGTRMANLSVATSERYKTKSGEWKTSTEWHKVVIWNDNLVSVAEKYLHKGSQVYIEGALKTRNWEDQSGQKRYSTEVVLSGYQGELKLLDKRESDAGGYSKPGSNADNLDDDIPY